jgi:hypothetical protein
MIRFVLAAMLGVAGAFVPPAASAAGALQRFALVVGANPGGANRPPLQYAVSDAERFARSRSASRSATTG